jgi:transcriptional regulator with XRE-family HTH domain
MPLIGSHLRTKRATAGISGAVIASKIGKSRSWLCEVECGYLTPPIEELTRISDAIDQVVQDRQQLSKLAADAGLSLAGIRL